MQRGLRFERGLSFLWHALRGKNEDRRNPGVENIQSAGDPAFVGDDYAQWGWGFFRLILACCKSLGMLSRTLSRFKLVCPIRTASARARWRNKCSLSSREVKSTGARVRVVTLPSAVMANVATTKGRLRTCERPLRRHVSLLTRIGTVSSLSHFHSVSPISCSSVTTSCSISRSPTRATAPLGL